MLNAWWDAVVPAGRLPVLVMFHEPGLESWLRTVDADAVVGVSHDEQPLYGELPNARAVVTRDVRDLTEHAIGAYGSRVNETPRNVGLRAMAYLTLRRSSAAVVAGPRRSANVSHSSANKLAGLPAAGFASAADAKVRLHRSSRDRFAERLFHRRVDFSNAQLAVSLLENRHDRVADASELASAVRRGAAPDRACTTGLRPVAHPETLEKVTEPLV